MRAKNVVAALFLVLFASSAAAQQAPAEEKGFRPEKLYDFSGIDSVNTFNGNVVVRLPIGMRYPLDGGLTYGLTLSYNSKVWDFEEVDEKYLQSSPGRRANAGMGWLLSMGRLVPPQDATNPTNNWIYESPDGADHSFASDRLYPTGAGCTGAYCGADQTMYTYDGSFLRMRQLTSSLRTIESGDGTVSEFELVSGSWRLKRIYNAFKDGSGNPLNYVDVLYPNPAAISVCPSASLVWQLHDSKGRDQFVCFKNQNMGGDTTPMVDRVVTTGVGENAIDLFEYDLNQTINKSCQDTVPPSYQTPSTFQVPFLRRVKLPDGGNNTCSADDCSRFQFSYFTTTGCPVGALQSITLPTLGKISYTYGAKDIQPNDPCSRLGSSTVGVATRTLANAVGTAMGTWTYDVANVLKGFTDYQNYAGCPGGPNGGLLYPIIRDEAEATVMDPFGDKVVQHYSVWPGNPGAQYDEISPDTFRRQDYSLPIGKYDPDVTANLATQVYDCNGSGQNCGLKRSSYVRYQLDPSTWDAELAHQTITAERTVYHDDLIGETPRYAHVEYSSYDGFGHYRTSVTSGTFENDNGRTSTTNFNPNADSHGSISGNLVFSTSDAWVLGTYDTVTTFDTTGTNTAKYCFDRSTGWLRATRTGTQSSTRDLVTLFAPETSSGSSTGNVASESYYGGDTKPLSGSAAAQSLCTIADNANPGPIGYRIDHTYSYGVRATSKYNGMFFYVADRDVHSTGLITKTREPNGLETTFSYDRAGRLTSVQPPGQVATTYVYNKAAVSGSVFTPARVTATTTSSTAGTVEGEYQFDSLGRYWREKRRMPDNTWSFREMLYDALNRKTSVSGMETLVVPGGGSEYTVNPQHKTTFTNYDPFGRAATITAPDAKTTTFSFKGVSATTRTVKIAMGETNDTSVATTETHDRHGRLIGVSEPGMTSTYGYDMSDRLTSVSMTDGTSTQSRLFQYDARGLLKKEQHPELGADGNGTTAYGADSGPTFVGFYDARGHATRKLTGSEDLTTVYDAAERVTAVKETSGQMLKRFLYDYPEESGSGACGSLCGKLTATARYNILPGLGIIAVTQAYQYDMATGQPGRRDWAIGSNGFFSGGDFFFSQTYNDLGDVNSVTYPCRTSNCDRTAPTLTLGYTRGTLTSVGSLASVAYQASGAIDTVTHSGSIHEIWTPDPNGMTRPASIRVTNAGNTELWSSGSYAYDGSGNVKQIGDTTYIYDAQNRLTRWRQSFGTGYGETVRGYDAFGNYLYSTEKGCAPGGAPCYSTGVLTLSVNSQTNHYDDLTYDGLGDVTSDGARTFTYDPLGVMTGANTAGRAFRYLYTADDERIALVEIGTPSGNKTTWTLRGFDNQLLSTWNDEVVGGTRVLAWKEDQFWRAGALLASTNSTGTKHYSLDHLGSPRYVTNATGGYIGTQSFEPFGGGGTINGGPNQFTGHERDSATLGGVDLPDYFHQRYYDLRLGRFLSVDPANTASPERLQSWNRYAYVSNNPLRAVDPDGMREALVYGVKRDVEPGYVVTLSTSQGNHVAVIADFDTSAGSVPTAMVLENVPVTPAGKMTFTDAVSHTPTVVSSSDPNAGAGLWNASSAKSVGVVENRKRDGTHFSADEVKQAGTLPVRYSNTEAGTRGPVCDCAGYVNQVVDRLGGTATSTKDRRSWWDRLRGRRPKEAEKNVADWVEEGVNK